MMRIILFTSIAIAWLVAGCGRDAELGTVQPATLQARLTTVRGELSPQEIEVFGSVHAGKEATLTSRAMGPVVKILSGAGDAVREGDVLLVIQERMSAGQLSQAQGALAQAQAALTIAEKNYARFRSLYEKDACSELELDMARMQYEQASGAVQQAGGAVETAASVAEEARLRAPFDAVVVRKMIDVGDLAMPGRPLMRIQSQTGREFAMQVRAADVAYVRVGDTITVELTTPSIAVDAVITEIAGGADPATHTFGVKADLGEADVRPGVTGRALFHGQKVSKLFIPEHTVYRAGGLALVSVVDENGLTHTRAVTTGRVRNGNAEILSGLRGGERIVTNRTGPIAEGTRIEQIQK